MSGYRAGAIAAICTLILAAPAAWGKTIYVEQWGESNLSCSKTAPCDDIYYPLRFVARKNDRILVGPGVYASPLAMTINTSAADGSSLEGLKFESSAGRNATILDATGSGQDIFWVFQPRVQIGKPGKGFTLIGGNRGIWTQAVTNFPKEKVRIEGNRFIDQGSDAISLFGPKLLIRGNIIESPGGKGISCSNCERSVIRGNRVSGAGSNGIAIGEDSPKVSLQENLVLKSTGYGIQLSAQGEFGSVKLKDNASLMNVFNGFHTDGFDGGFAKGNIAAMNENHGYRMGSIDPDSQSSFARNLAVANENHGFQAVSNLRTRFDGNTIVGNAGDGIASDGDVLYQSLSRNNTWNSGSRCGFDNDTAGGYPQPKKHFYGSSDGADDEIAIADTHDANCDNTPIIPAPGTSSSTANPVRVGKAARL